MKILQNLFVQNHFFCLLKLPRNPSARHIKLHLDLKLKNLKTNFQNWETIATSVEMLLTFVLLIPPEPLYCLPKLSSNPISSPKNFAGP